MRIERGRIYVAPPNHHMTVGPIGFIRLDQGPRENHTRPAADPLFRSAASIYGSRVMGIILTGGGSDGTQGLIAVEQAGGLAIVQDPVMLAIQVCRRALSSMTTRTSACH